MGLLRSSALNFAAQLALAASAFGASIAVARVLGPQGAGSYSALVYLMLVLVTLSTSGLATTVVREVSERTTAGDDMGAESGRDWLGLIAWRISVVTAVATAVAGIIVDTLAAHPDGISGTAIVVASASIPFATSIALSTAALQGRRRFDLTLLLGCATGVMALTGVAVALAIGGGVTSLVASTLVVTVVAALLARRLAGVPQRRLPTAEQRARLISFAVPVSVIAVMDLVVWEKSEVFVLGAFRSTEQVAYYALAYTLVSRTMALGPGSLSGVLLSHFAGDAARGDLEESFPAAWRYLVLVTAPIVTIGVVFADPVVAACYGHAYRPMVPTLRVLVVSAGLAAVISAGSSALYGASRQRFLVRLAIVIGIVNVVADFAVIPRWGATGAACCNGGAQLLGIAAGLWYLVTRMRFRVPWCRSAAMVGAAVATAVLARLSIAPLHLQPIAETAVGALTALLGYTVFAAFTPLLTSDERRQARAMLVKAAHRAAERQRPPSQPAVPQ